MIPYGRQSISQADIDAVLQVLQSDWLTQGPAVPRFEEAVGAITGGSLCTAVCNATAALHLACRALDLGPGDRLWTSPITFVASANCGLYCGAEVDFVDIDPVTCNMDVDALASKLQQARQANALPKVVVPVHFAGQSCDMQAIAQLAQEYGFRVIEDASHAIGGSHHGEPIGSCRWSDMTVFSFHPVKIVTTGEGGMLLTRDEALHQRVQLLRSHGVTREPALMHGESDGPWYYQQVDLGYNYRMTDMQAALGTSQLDRLGEFIERRRALVARYAEALSDLPLVLPRETPGNASAWHLYTVRLREDAPTDRLVVFNRLRDAGIGVNVHYIPVHTQPWYRDLGFAPGDFPQAERYYATAISLPMFPTLEDAAQDEVIAALRQALAHT